MDSMPVEDILAKIDNEGVSYFFTEYTSSSLELDFTNIDEDFDVTEEEKEEIREAFKSTFRAFIQAESRFREFESLVSGFYE